MGGDHAPAEIVAGAVSAARDRGIGVLLTGRPGQLRPLLARHGAQADIRIVPAEDSVAMDEGALASWRRDRKSTRLNSSHQIISYAVFCLKKKKTDFI